MDAPAQSNDENAPMEEVLTTTLSNMISQQGVKGVLVTDHEGLCVAARGSLDAANAARFTSTLENAAKLGGETDEVPTVTVETAQSTITIVSKDGFITAVCK